jgi:hypothetical protein
MSAISCPRESQLVSIRARERLAQVAERHRRTGWMFGCHEPLISLVVQAEGRGDNSSDFATGIATGQCSTARDGAALIRELILKKDNEIAHN